MKLMEIYKTVAGDLQEIEKELHQAIHTDQALLHQACEHLLQAGGKRIRPVIVLLGGKSGTYDMTKLTFVGVALELIHMATLVHDDVIDDAETRRGKPTVKAKWDNRLAMYVGDFIMARGLHYITQLENPRIHRILAHAIVEMCKGEMEQIKALYEWNQNLRHYLRRIKRKTALLMAVSCQLGGLACNANEKVVQALYNYGYYIGMAFQITDDILDFTGTEKELGKPAGSDLLQGNITLPVLAAFQNSDIRYAIQEQMEQNEPNLAQIIGWIKQCGGIEHSQRLAQTYLDKARQCVADIPDSRNQQLFQGITDFIYERTY